MNTTIFLILTIVPLIITILYYFGIFRYFQLHSKSSEKYIKNYKNLNKASDNKVIISFISQQSCSLYIKSDFFNKSCEQ